MTRRASHVRETRASYGAGRFTAVVSREGRWCVGLCPELDVASQGRTVEQALGNLREAVQLYLEHASPDEIRGTLREDVLVTTLDIAECKSSC